MKKDTAICLRLHPYSETSQIVHWCSYEHGIIHSIIRGNRKNNNRDHGRIDLFYTIEAIFTPAKKSDLYNIRDPHTLDNRPGLRDDYHRLCLATVCVEWLEILCERNTPIPNLYHLLDRALEHIRNHIATAKILHHYEKRLAEELGLSNPNQPNTPPHYTLQQHNHRSPASRDNFLRLLPEKNDEKIASK